MMSPRLRSAIKISVTLLFAASSAFAQNIINVPADQPTIQAAINVAAPGDTVIVAPGTYVENINFSGKSITVTSSGGASSTIIDGNASSTVVTFNQGETASAVLNGFTIRNGRSLYYAGGIEISGASAKITNNIITGNGGISGIAIDVEGGSPLIQGNTITNNVQNAGSGGGGAIYISAPSGATSNVSVIGNTITDNHLDAGATGGGISLNYYASALIENNYIARNSAYNGGGGIAASSNASLVIVGNVITNNSSGGGGDGGAFYNVGSGPVLFLNNTLYGDSSSVVGTSEIAIGGFVTNSTFKNNIVYATSGNPISCPNGAAVVSATNNLVYYVAPATNVNYCSRFPQLNGILSEPGMVNPANGDFRLHVGSPAIDAGNSDSNLPQTDLSGTTRVLDGNNDGVATVDIGAYEFVPGAPPAGWAVLAPLGATFPNTVVGATSSTINFTLLNNGNAPLTITSISVNAPFAQTNTCPAVLAVQVTCLIQVTFTPSGGGSFSGILSVTNDGGGGTATALLNGFGGTVSGTLTPGSLDFGHVAAGASSNVQNVTVTNTGTMNLPLHPIILTGPFSSASGTCLRPVSLAPGASCTIGVVFSPTTSGSASGTLQIVSNNPPTTPTVVTLSGVGDGPSISVTPSALSFGTLAVGSSQDQVVTIDNAGNQPLTIFAIQSSPNFAQTNNCGSSVPAGASCNIDVTFAPTARGSISGSLLISSNAPSGSNAAGNTATVSLTGIGIAPITSVTPASVTFGSQLLGTTSAVQTVTLSNTGDSALSITSIAAPAPFAQTNNCGTSLAAGASCTISISFAPTARGAASGNLTVNVAAPAASQTVALSGTGIAPTASLSSASLTFPLQRDGTASSAQTVTLSNSGNSTLTISSIGISGASVFSQTNNCQATLAAGASCSINVSFLSVQTGSYSGSVVVTDDSGAVSGSQQTVSLTGSSGASTANFSPTSLLFANTSVGASSTAAAVTVTNSGNMSLNISSISVSGDFSQSNNCASSVAAGASCVVNVVFTPTAAGTRNGTLTVADDSQNGGVQTVALSGTGLAVIVPPSTDVVLSKDQGTASSSITVSGLSTRAAGEYLLAFVATDGPGSSSMTVSSITTSGLTWKLLARANQQSGTAEIWGAWSTSALINASVQARLPKSESASLTVVALIGVNSVNPIGTTAVSGARSGAPTLTLNTVRTNSVVFAVGNDWDNAISRTVGPNQTLIHQFLSPVGDSYWLQGLSAPIANPATVTINDVAPTSDRYNLAAVEVLAQN